MLIEQPPRLLRLLYPRAQWRMSAEERAVYITFDDGPIPEATLWILDILDRYGVKATFFVVGDNVRKYPHIYREVVARGHSVGNHTFHHISGHIHGDFHFQHDVEECADIMHTAAARPQTTLLPLFRPPHGWMKPKQYRYVANRYRIVMWDVVTRDYSRHLTAADVLHNVKRYARPGSIITFHDSLKSIDKLHTALPAAIEWLQDQGYELKPL